jgi:hypothetical protein
MAVATTGAATIADLAVLVRSKNAGPFWLTIDIMFDDAEKYRRVRDSDTVNRAVVAKMFRRDPADIIVVNHDAALAIKVNFPRPQSSSSKEIRQRRLWRPAIRATAVAHGAGLKRLSCMPFGPGS